MRVQAGAPGEEPAPCDPDPIVLLNGRAGVAERLSKLWGRPVRSLGGALGRGPYRARGTVVFVDDLLAGGVVVPDGMAIMARPCEDLVNRVAVCGAAVVAAIGESDEVLRLAWQAWRSGSRLVSPAVAAKLLYPLYGSTLRSAGQAFGAALTGREAQVLEHLLAGVPNAEIATAMSIRRSTVETHVRSILRKYGVTDRLHLALTYLSGRPGPGVPRREDIHARMDAVARA